ncbi:MAG TPA: hypothetical protein VF278_03610 [Pirellulales bacterium]
MAVLKWILASLTVLAITVLLLRANAPRKVGYPEVLVTTPVGTPGICHHCGKAITEVGPEHLLSAKSAEYVVCGEQCAAEMLQWHKANFGQ